MDHSKEANGPPTNPSDRAAPTADARPLPSSWDDLDFGVALLLGLTAFVAGCVGLAVGVVAMWMVQ